ncbi:MAG: thiamine diphosphokinase [Lachnospiraceae bacterium]|nr:thiamine diphosphokinase [Lachnospiraceae bacterium]
MSVLVVTGGNVDVKTAGRYLCGRRFDHVIAVDAGVLAAEQMGLSADYLVGDFDTLGEEGLLQRAKAGVAVRRYDSHKDDTDTEIAVSLALELERAKEAGGAFFPERVVLLGATGTRFDHTLANVFLLELFAKAGISACIVDANNRISVHRAGFCFPAKGQFGKYISFLALTPEVTGLTLRGFCYPLHQHTLLQESSLCISNEAAEGELFVDFSAGTLLMAETMD